MYRTDLGPTGYILKPFLETVLQQYNFKHQCDLQMCRQWFFFFFLIIVYQVKHKENASVYLGVGVVPGTL